MFLQGFLACQLPPMPPPPPPQHAENHLITGYCVRLLIGTPTADPTPPTTHPISDVTERLGTTLTQPLGMRSQGKSKRRCVTWPLIMLKSWQVTLLGRCVDRTLEIRSPSRVMPPVYGPIWERIGLWLKDFLPLLSVSGHVGPALLLHTRLGCQPVPRRTFIWIGLCGAGLSLAQCRDFEPYHWV